MYDLLFRAVLSKMDPERAHHLAFDAIRAMPMLGIGRIVHRFTRSRTDISVSTMGLTFPTPFGIAAGFDKDGKAIRGLGQLGFGHVEVGTLTPLAQPGNDKPRLFRLVADRAIINRMGFNNEGVTDSRPRFARESARRIRPVIGANIGKNRATSVEDAIHDYRLSAQQLVGVSDYLVVNVSSPNTPGLRGLQEAEQLRPLLAAVQAVSQGKPLLVKIAPDLVDEDILDICALVRELGLAGIIATNTTIERSGLRTNPATVSAAGAGGLSGRPLAVRSLEVLALIRTVLPMETCVISVGGVTTAQDVADRLSAGATLVQGYTAFLYVGPMWARRINRGLDHLLKP
ncbi:quinone-dependent dihydroorotate dehydrogenase [Klugiella xanthotipulae]|uniref:quinone-dependent dihydroorotate dehydrogenase n=1 Tax=Klugiella xanthotipulae TaxID=244735 RepID=UPI00115191EB|nr:quinone-dependent dihydroorotate dehydrogenase [Klugiella xanthotipulae]